MFDLIQKQDQWLAICSFEITSQSFMFEAGQQCTYTGKRVLVYDSVLYPNITRYDRDIDAEQKNDNTK